MVRGVQRKRLMAGMATIPLSCAALALSGASADASPATTIPGDGIYVVGVDIQPGKYSLYAALHGQNLKLRQSPGQRDWLALHWAEWRGATPKLRLHNL
jgi:hypothetical protein